MVNEDVQPRQYLMCGQTAQVKLKNVVPHDIGDPGEGLGGPTRGQRRSRAVHTAFSGYLTAKLWEGGVVPGVHWVSFSGNEKLGWFGVVMKTMQHRDCTGNEGRLSTSGKAALARDDTGCSMLF